MSRLKLASRELARKFDGASEALRLRALVAACETASSGTGLDDPESQLALAAIRAGTVVDSATADRLRAWSERLGATEDEEGSPQFRTARAAEALATAAISGLTSAGDAIYEASFAAEPGAVFEAVEWALDVSRRN